MRKVIFNACCPYEIGDKVIKKPLATERTIEDIRTIHYLASGNVEFEARINGISEYFPIGSLIPVNERSNNNAK